MKTDALGYGFAIPCGVLLIGLACGETANNGSGSGTTGMEDSSAGGLGGSGADTVGAGTTGASTNSAVSSSVVTAVTSSVVTSSATTSGGAGGGGNTSQGGSGSSAGGASSSSAGGAAGAPMTNTCDGCELSTETFGQDCDVWVCFAPGSG